MIRDKKIENYMKTIYQLKRNGPVRGAYIARELGVTKPTVSATIRELVDEGFIVVLEDIVNEIKNYVIGSLKATKATQRLKQLIRDEEARKIIVKYFD